MEGMEIYILIGVAAVALFALIYGVASWVFLGKLSTRVDALNHYRDQMMLQITDLHREKSRIVNDLNRLKDLTDAAVRANTKRIAEAEEKLKTMTDDVDLASRLSGLEACLKGIRDIMEEEHRWAAECRSEGNESDSKACCNGDDEEDEYVPEGLCAAFAKLCDEDTEKEKDCEAFADIPGDLDEGFEGEESITEEQKKEASLRNILELPSPVYKWEFPSDDPSFHTELPTSPIVGMKYLVIGHDKRLSNVNNIVSGVGVWRGFCAGRGYCGFDMEDEYELDRVYAYVQMPSASDVMQKVIDVKLKEDK